VDDRYRGVKFRLEEIVEQDVYLLSTADEIVDSMGRVIRLSEGLDLSLYAEDVDEFGGKVVVFASGVAELNVRQDWSRRVRWCCRIVRWEADGASSE
jgi:hypothetical protein